MSTAFESFATVHQYQLAPIPKELWEPLFMKLGEDYLDAGEFFELHYGDPLSGYSLHLKAAKTLQKHSNIFLIDHAWTTSPETAVKELIQNPALLDRLENLMDIEKEEFISDDEDDNNVTKPSDELIQLVASQANVSEKQAEEALLAENNEVVNAIMRLTLDEDAKQESERLEEQVLGQMLASGQPQEKEEKEKKERSERRKKREEEWMKGRANAMVNQSHRQLGM
ncbi:hypothetical protein RMATCC62417_17441 [Rhizopus microsporus]|nr:hypothetical protein RMATCC62417_17441 [Rhizopus microsporus]